ncbi:hypothetical protein MRX96_000269 [Rhipicephalus microplus]
MVEASLCERRRRAGRRFEVDAIWVRAPAQLPRSHGAPRCLPRRSRCLGLHCRCRVRSLGFCGNGGIGLGWCFRCAETPRCRSAFVTRSSEVAPTLQRTSE